MIRNGNKSCNVIVTPSNLKVKGKMASLTENRRLSWEMILRSSIFYSKRVSDQKRSPIWDLSSNMVLPQTLNMRLLH